MINIVICDDDDGYCSRIERWLMVYDKREKVGFNISIYNSAKHLLKHMENKSILVDFIFLDIELPGISGVEFGNWIRRAHDIDEVGISFISGHTKYCKELFAIEPINFHQKPLHEDEIIADIEKYMRRSKRNKKTLKYIEDGVPRLIQLRDICWISALVKKVEVMMNTGEKKVINKSFQECCNEIGENGLCQCHRSFLVNLSYVKSYKYRTFYFEDGTEVPVGKSFVETMKGAWAHFEYDMI